MSRTRVVVGHPFGRASVRRAGRLVLWSQLRRLAAVLERSLPVVPGAHHFPVPGVRRPRRAAATNATTAPALASTGADRGQRRRDHVLLDGRVGVGRQPVALGRLGQQEERAEAAGELLVGLVAGAVQVGALDAAPMQLGDPTLTRARPAPRTARTGSSRSGTTSRTPARGRPRGGRSRACTCRRARPRGRGRRRRTDTPARSSRSRCRRQAAAPPSDTRCGSARRSGRRRGSPRWCSACRRRT